jgi:hypothetical protein
LTAALGSSLILLALIALPNPSPATAAQSSAPGDGRTPVPNRGQVELEAGRFGAETPARAHNIRFFPGAQPGRKIIRFELRPGEHRATELSGAERAELRSYSSYHHGQTRWYAGAFRLGEFTPDSLFNIIMQWHSEAAVGSPWLRFALDPGRPGQLLIQHRGSDAHAGEREYETTALEISLNRWHRFVVEVRTDPRDGLLRVWIDGRLQVDWAHGLLGDFRRHGAREPRLGFWKFGFYRWRVGRDRQPVRATALLWFTNMEQGSDLSARVNRPLPLPRPGAWAAN